MLQKVMPRAVCVAGYFTAKIQQFPIVEWVFYILAVRARVLSHCKHAGGK